MRKFLNTALSHVSSVSIFQFSEHFQLIFGNSNVNNGKQMKQKIANFSELPNFSSSSLWAKPLWNQKLLLLTATAQRSCHTLVRYFTTLSFFSIFLELIFESKIKSVLLKQSAVLLTSCQKNIVYIMSLNTENIVHK